MGYVTIAFTVPKGAKVATFSASGTPTPTRTRDSGTCEANWRETGGDTDHDHDHDHEMDERDRIGASFVASPETSGPGKPGSRLGLAPGPGPGPVAASPVDPVDGGSRADGSATLSPDGSFAMTWRHLPGNRVRFTLIADAPAWMSIGIHRPGGRGMPGADMIVAQSLDGGIAWTVSEAWTSAYDRPRAKAFYGHATSGLDPNACAVEVGSDGRVVVTFTRDASVDAEENPTGASVERGEIATVVWARGDPGVVAMDYHGARRGTVTVTW